MATLKAKETLHLPAGAKARALPKTGKLIARAKLKRNKPRVKRGANGGPSRLQGVMLSTSVEYPVK